MTDLDALLRCIDQGIALGLSSITIHPRIWNLCVDELWAQNPILDGMTKIEVQRRGELILHGVAVKSGVA